MIVICITHDVGDCFVLNFCIYRIFFCQFARKMSRFGGFSDVIPKIKISSLDSQKARSSMKTRHLSHQSWKSIQGFEMGPKLQPTN